MRLTYEKSISSKAAPWQLDGLIYVLAKSLALAVPVANRESNPSQRKQAESESHQPASLAATAHDTLALLH